MRHAYVLLRRTTGDARGQRQQLGVHQRLDRGRHSEPRDEQRYHPEEGARPAVPDRHRAAVRRSHEHPNDAGDDQLQDRCALPLAMDHRRGRDLQSDRTDHQVVDDLNR